MMTSSNGTWWRHQMKKIPALLAICAGNSPVPGEFPAQRPVTRSFDVFFDLRPKKRLSKQSWGWWFGMLSRSVWRHCNQGVVIGSSIISASVVQTFWNFAQSMAVSPLCSRQNFITSQISYITNMIDISKNRFDTSYSTKKRWAF